MCWNLTQVLLWARGDTDRFSFSFALNTSSRLLWGSMALARRVTDLDMAWQFFLCISSHWMLLSDLSFFSSDILKEKAKVRDNVGSFISNLSDFSGKSKPSSWPHLMLRQQLLTEYGTPILARMDVQQAGGFSLSIHYWPKRASAVGIAVGTDCRVLRIWTRVLRFARPMFCQLSHLPVPSSLFLSFMFYLRHVRALP